MTGRSSTLRTCLHHRFTYTKPTLFLLASLSLLQVKPAHAFHNPAFWSANRQFGNSIIAHNNRSSNKRDVVSSKRQHGDAIHLNMQSAKRDSPSAQRNKEPIWEILSSKVLPSIKEPLQVLEVACGNGVHSHHFALQLEQQGKIFEWYPSDPDEESRASTQVYLDDEPSLKDKMQSPIDVTLAENGPMDSTVVNDKMFNLVTCINMIHISPWSATLGLMKMAGDQLSSCGILFLYGPYKVNGQTAESNLRFDESLKSRDPGWGVRDLETVLVAAEKNGLVHKETIEMPANNLSIILQKM